MLLPSHSSGDGAARLDGAAAVEGRLQQRQPSDVLLEQRVAAQLPGHRRHRNGPEPRFEATHLKNLKQSVRVR